MDKNYINKIIAAFFRSGGNPETAGRFGRWLVSNVHEQEKRQAMLDLWEQNMQECSETASEAELAEIRRRIGTTGGSSRREFLIRLARIAAAIMLPIAGALPTYEWMRRKENRLPLPVDTELTENVAAYGERSHFILPDGTEAWLNSGSSIVYEKNFTGATRSIFLRGEAHFSVAHDASKPFVVKTECIDVTALGTTFNVQSYPDAMKIIATLESGKIKIQSGQNELHSTVILYPNEQLTYDRGTNEFVTRKVDASRNTRWTHGFTIFQGNTVDEIVGTLERRFKISVRYDAARFAGRTFTVRFSPDEDVREVFDILKVIIGFQYRTEGSVIHII